MINRPLRPDRPRCHSACVLEPKQVAQAYARWIADGEPDFQAMMSPICTIT
jgi:hypothetical protein